MSLAERLLPDGSSIELPFLEVFVRGLPQAQGSARAFMAKGRAFIATEAHRTSSPLGAWRGAIATEARAAMGHREPTRDAVLVKLEFVFPRPLNHYRSGKAERGLSASAPAWAKGSKPDLDKLIRAALDALTGVAWVDDAQVAVLRAVKLWGETPGVRVQVVPA